VSDADVVPAGRQLSWNPPLAWLPRSLREPDNALKSIAVGWLLAFPASILFAVIIHLIAPNAKTPEFPITGPLAIGLLVFFSPILESLIMGCVLLILLRFLPPTWAVIASAIGWGVAHSLAAPIWGMIIWWPFLIFSTLFVTWRARSLTLAFTIPMIVHGLQNLPPALLVASGVS
jgi:hypothetical protein